MTGTGRFLVTAASLAEELINEPGLIVLDVRWRLGWAGHPLPGISGKQTANCWARPDGADHLQRVMWPPSPS
jgi:hypothetical protein